MIDEAVTEEEKDRWEEVARIFGLVMDAGEDERVAILDHECGDDDELRAEIEELLAADEPTAGDVAGMVAGAVQELVTHHDEANDNDDEALTSAGMNAGDLIDERYAITRVLGSGGMGVVVAAEHRGLDETVAIKLLRPGALATERVRRRFLREAKAAARLKSPHVVKVRDVGTLSTGAPYMVMELLEGADLAAVLRARGPLPATEACLVLLQACEALATAHARGVIHRDIKPGNLFLERAPHGDLTLKLLDFGISKLVGGEPDEEGVLTRTSDMVGSPAYMSPEQLRSARDVDARSDIWSLGVVLYEMLRGQRPFRADNVADLSMMILAEPPPPLEGDVPPALARVVERCLSKERDARYADVGELAQALAPFCGPEGHRICRRVLATLGAPPTDEDDQDDPDWALADTIASAESITPPPPKSQSPKPDETRRPRTLVALAAVAVVAAGAIALGTSSSDDRDPAAGGASPSATPIASATAPAFPATSPVPTASASAADAAEPSAPPPTMPPPTTPPALPKPTATPSVDPYGTRK